MKSLFGAAAAALCFASPVFAQDESDTFGGVSVAVIGGIDALSIQQDDAADSSRGALYGASVGYDHDVGNVVIGVQAEYTDSAASFDIDDLLVAGDEFTSAAGRNLYGGVRIGMRTGNRALLYIGGGYVDSKLTSRYRDATDTLEESETKGGFRVSGGGELGFGKKVFGRLELRYQDLGNYNVFGVPTGFARTNTQIVAGLGARF